MAAKKTLQTQTYQAIQECLEEVFNRHAERVKPFYVHPKIEEEPIGHHLLKDQEEKSIYVVRYSLNAPFDCQATVTFLRDKQHLQYTIEGNKTILVSAFEIDEEGNGRVLIAGINITEVEGQGLLNELEYIFDV